MNHHVQQALPFASATALLLALCASFNLPNAGSDPIAHGPSAHGVELERAFPRLRFDRPVYLTGAGDGSGRVFVVEQAGVVRVLEGGEDPARSRVFLDITERVSRRGNEEGLIGLAFHPNFKRNGEVFVHYSASGEEPVGILSRFRLDKQDTSRLDPASEEILLRQPQPWRNHNGGMIEFGPDGYLYIPFGDGGSANDPNGNGQNLKTWLGSMLRIDVDQSDEEFAYGIPPDNPFLMGPDGARPEIYAFGFRNIWRFSFDRETGELWAGDVGQNKIEEIDLVVMGGNYGWKRFEAESLFDATTRLTLEPAIDPVSSYERSEGISITGGYVYRGARFPSLQGTYFYGDYASGNIWSVRPGEGGEYETDFVCRSGRSIASFGEDDEGELFVCSFDGGIYRVVPSDGPEDTFSDWPERLSETGLFTWEERRAQPAPHLVAYEVNASFWSDKAEKTRFIVLPEGTSLGYQAEGAWDVPVGATLIKHFRGKEGRGTRDLETRLIKRTAKGWEAATYVWDGKDARLAPWGQQFELWTRAGVQSWHAPSSSECASCHVDATGFPLGIKTAQLNLNREDGTNQISALAAAGHVQLPGDFNPDTAERFVDPRQADAPIEERARVWLDVNCAMCHQPDGPGNATIDLRNSRSLPDTGLVGAQAGQGELGLQDAMLLAPGAPARSLLLHRIRTVGDGRMPPIGSNLVDEEAVELLSTWIEGLDAK